MLLRLRETKAVARIRLAHVLNKYEDQLEASLERIIALNSLKAACEVRHLYRSPLGLQTH